MLAWAMLTASAGFAETPSYIGRHDSTPEDLKAITKVTDDCVVWSMHGANDSAKLGKS